MLVMAKDGHLSLALIVLAENIFQLVEIKTQQFAA
jgi:hypothetical protein